MPRYHITRKDVIAFTEGDCWALAKSLSERTGWQAYAIGIYPEYVENGQVKKLERFDWVHLIVQTPSGRYLDVNGLSTTDELMKQYIPALKKYYGWEADTLEFRKVSTEQDYKDLMMILYRQFEADVEKVAQRLLYDYEKTVGRESVHSFGGEFSNSLADLLSGALS